MGKDFHKDPMMYGWTMVEEVGYRRLGVILGAPPEQVGIDVRDFTLR
jgi:hypothetical protein